MELAVCPEAIVKAIRPKAFANGTDEEIVMDEEVAKRRAIIRSNPNRSTRELCEPFDHRRVPVQSGGRMQALSGGRRHIRVVSEGVSRT